VSRGRWLEAALGVAVALHVFAVVLGQTRAFSLLELGWRLRWVTLVAAFVVALLLALAVRARPAGRLVAPLALAAILVALAFVSALWSVRPEFTLPRAASFALVLGLGALVGTVGAVRPSALRAVALGLLGGGTLVAVGGLLVLAVSYDTAVEAATLQDPARYNGLGGNPNTAAVLEALTLPFAIWVTLGPFERRLRLAGAAAIVLLVASIVASGSRAAAIAAAVGTLVPLLAHAHSGRARLLVAGGVIAVLAGGLLATQIPDVRSSPPPSSAASGSAAPPPSAYENAEAARPLADELGGPRPGSSPYRRTLLSSGGRFRALEGAVELGLQRPLLGFGFGTEDKVFVDRYYLFFASRPENAYAGTFLQIGVVGLALALAFVVAVLLRLSDALARREALLAASCGGAVLGGLVLANAQSFALSAGASGAATFWIASFLLAGAAEVK
jgi:hypothetical protein